MIEKHLLMNYGQIELPYGKSSLDRELQEVVGKEDIRMDEKSLSTYARSSTPTHAKPSLIVYPENTEEVSEILKICQAYHAPCHAISTGKNWGYTDACAPQDGCVIIHLEKMNRLISFEEELGVLRIEPGVTQGQVAKYLENRKANWMLDVTGAGPDTSIIGNICERGFGHGALGDRFVHSMNYEVVLPTGQILNTGFGENTKNHCADTYKWGLGASLDGLFCQSNLGIITKMTIWLTPKPEVFKGIFLKVQKDEDIYEIIDKLRPLKMDGTIQTNLHFGNDLRLFAMNTSSPKMNDSDQMLLNTHDRKSFRKIFGIGAWNGSMGVLGSKGQVKMHIKKIKKALKNVKGVEKIFIMDENKINRLMNIAKAINRLFGISKYENLVKKMRQGFELLQGIPSENSIQGCLWRSKLSLCDVQSNDPLDYQAGFLWISPILPMRSNDLKKLQEITQPIFNKYQFDYLNTLTMINQRSLVSVMTICYEKNNELEQKKARLCHDEVLTLLNENGFPLYRSGNLSFKSMEDFTGNKDHLLSQIKKCLDPTLVLSPYKYSKSM